MPLDLHHAVGRSHVDVVQMSVQGLQRGDQRLRIKRFVQRLRRGVALRLKCIQQAGEAWCCQLHGLRHRLRHRLFRGHSQRVRQTLFCVCSSGGQFGGAQGACQAFEGVHQSHGLLGFAGFELRLQLRGHACQVGHKTAQHAHIDGAISAQAVQGRVNFHTGRERCLRHASTVRTFDSAWWWRRWGRWRGCPRRRRLRGIHVGRARWGVLQQQLNQLIQVEGLAHMLVHARSQAGLAV